MYDTVQSFFNNQAFDFASESLDTVLAKKFEKNKIQVDLVSQQVTAPGELQGLINIDVVERLLSGKFKIKLLTTFEMRILKKKQSMALDQIIRVIKEEETPARQAVYEVIRKRRQSRLLSQLRIRILSLKKNRKAGVSERFGGAGRRGGVRMGRFGGDYRAGEASGGVGGGENGVENLGGFGAGSGGLRGVGVRDNANDALGGDGEGREADFGGIMLKRLKSGKSGKSASSAGMESRKAIKKSLFHKTSQRTIKKTKTTQIKHQSKSSISDQKSDKKHLKTTKTDTKRPKRATPSPNLLSPPKKIQKIQNRKILKKSQKSAKIAPLNHPSSFHSNNNPQLYHHLVSTISTQEVELFTLTNDVKPGVSLSLPFSLDIPKDYPETVVQDLEPTTRPSFPASYLSPEPSRPRPAPKKYNEYVRLHHQLLITYEADARTKDNKVVELANEAGDEGSDGSLGSESSLSAPEKHLHYINLEVFRGSFLRKATVQLTDLFQRKRILAEIRRKRCFGCLGHRMKWEHCSIDIKLNKQVFYGRDDCILLDFRVPEVLHGVYDEIDLLLVCRKIVKKGVIEAVGEAREDHLGRFGGRGGARRPGGATVVSLEKVPKDENLRGGDDGIESFRDSLNSIEGLEGDGNETRLKKMKNEENHENEKNDQDDEIEVKGGDNPASGGRRKRSFTRSLTGRFKKVVNFSLLTNVLKTDIFSKIKDLSVTNTGTHLVNTIKRQKDNMMAMLHMITKHKPPINKVATITHTDRSTEPNAHPDSPKTQKTGSKPPKHTKIDKILYRGQVDLEPLKSPKIVHSKVYQHRIELGAVKSQLQNLHTRLMAIDYSLAIFLNKGGMKFERFVCEYPLEFRAIPSSMNVIRKGKLSLKTVPKKSMAGTVRALVERQRGLKGDGLVVLPFAKVDLEDLG